MCSRIAGTGARGGRRVELAWAGSGLVGASLATPGFWVGRLMLAADLANFTWPDCGKPCGFGGGVLLCPPLRVIAGREM